MKNPIVVLFEQAYSFLLQDNGYHWLDQNYLSYASDINSLSNKWELHDLFVPGSRGNFGPLVQCCTPAELFSWKTPSKMLCSENTALLQRDDCSTWMNSTYYNIIMLMFTKQNRKKIYFLNGNKRESLGQSNLLSINAHLSQHERTLCYLCQGWQSTYFSQQFNGRNSKWRANIWTLKFS